MHTSGYDVDILTSHSLLVDDFSWEIFLLKLIIEDTFYFILMYEMIMCTSLSMENNGNSMTIEWKVGTTQSNM